MFSKVSKLRGVGTTHRAAAPEGGHRLGGWVRGCVLVFGCVAPTLACAQVITVPSGQSVQFVEQIIEADTNTLRLRYLAPDIGSGLTRPSFEKLTEDLDYLCQTEGLPAAQISGLDAAQIVISLSAEPVEFGVLSPDVEQVFEAFVVENGACMLEVF